MKFYLKDISSKVIVTCSGKATCEECKLRFICYTGSTLNYVPFYDDERHLLVDGSYPKSLSLLAFDTLAYENIYHCMRENIC